MRYAYPYALHPQPEGGFTVIFPDVPEAITQGDTEQEAERMAEDALVTALSFYTDKGEPLPRPSLTEGLPLAYAPPLVAATPRSASEVTPCPEISGSMPCCARPSIKCSMGRRHVCPKLPAALASRQPALETRTLMSEIE